jgi:hypothetical protein
MARAWEASLWWRHLVLLDCHASPREGDMEGLCCSMHRSTNYNWHTWGQCLLIGIVPSRRTVEADVALDRLSGGCKAPVKGDPFWRWPSGFFADWISCGEPRPHQVSLSNVRVTIIMFMRVLVVESLCQTTMGWILTLECLLSGARGSQWLHLILYVIKWLCRLMMSIFESFA